MSVVAGAAAAAATAAPRRCDCAVPIMFPSHGRRLCSRLILHAGRQAALSLQPAFAFSPPVAGAVVASATASISSTSSSRPTVVIVESPSKVAAIERYLGPGYVVMASYGHIRDLVPKARAGGGGGRPLWEARGTSGGQLQPHQGEATRSITSSRPTPPGPAPRRGNKLRGHGAA